MRFNEFLLNLRSLAVTRIYEIEPKAEIITAQRWEKGMEKLSSEVLYLLVPAQLTECIPSMEKRCSFLVCGVRGDEPELSAFGGRCNLAVTPESDVSLVLATALEVLLTYYQRRSSGIQSVLRGFLQDRGLQFMVDSAYTVLRNPIFISDITNTYLAWVYDEDSFQPNGPFAKFVLGDILTGHIEEAALEFIRTSGIDSALRSSSGTIRRYHPNFRVDVLYGVLRIQNVMVGRIWMPAIEHPFTQMDEELFESLTRLVEQELRRSSHRGRTGKDYHAAMLADLLTVTHLDRDILSRSKTAFHIAEGSELFAAVAVPGEEVTKQPALAMLQEKWKQVFPSQQATVLDGRLVMLFSLPPGGDIQRSMLRDFALQNNLLVGVSNRFQSLEQIQHEYQQAIRTVELSRELRLAEPVITFDDVAVFELLQCYRGQGKVSSLVSPHIRRLYDYDRENGSDYLKTLEAYFAYQGKPQAICDALHIHKNTLLYRIKRISSMFGLKLDNGEEVLKYQLSIAIIRYVSCINQE